MIRVKCPKCEKMLGMDDAKAGTLAACPGCGTKFRIPGQKAGVEAAAAKTKPGAKGPKKAKKPDGKVKRPWGGEEPDDFTPYALAKTTGPDRPPDTTDADEMARLHLRAQERNKAWKEVGFPSTLMKIMGLSMCLIFFLSFMYTTVSVVLYTHQMAMFRAGGEREGGGVFRPTILPPFNNLVPQHMSAGALEWLAVGIFVFALLFFGFILAAAEKMKKLEGYGMAMAGSILALIAFLPIGAVALMALLNEDVKREFPGGKPAMDEEEEEDEEEEDEDDEYEDEEEDEDE